jgi:MoaA/NifB/PqqE/SkfB family radical SAM enzyme
MDILEQSNLYLSYMSSDHIPFPKSLQVELTSYCNLKCVMCPKTLGVYRSEPNKSMEMDVLDYIVTSILPYVHRVDVVGDGEPLLAPDLLFYLLENANFFKIPVTICSNGILLTPEFSRKLIEHELADLNISIDAATAGTYNKIRGADFDVLINNIKSLNELKAEAGSPFPALHFSMVAMKDNIEELPLVLDLASSLKADWVTLQAMGEESEDLKGQSVFLHNRDLAEEILYKSIIEADAKHYQLKLWPERLLDVLASNDDIDHFLCGDAPPPGDPSAWRKDCSFLWSTPFITTNGDVRPCCANLPPMGNLNHDSFHDIWYGSAYSALRKNMLTGHLADACLRCPGMGWRKIQSPKHYLFAKDEIFNLYPGWYDLELEERNYRWSRERSVLYLKPTNADKFLLLQARRAALPNAPSNGTIVINGESSFHVVLKSTNWETIEIPLPGLPVGDLVQVELNLTHSVRPADIDKASRDPRDLGIKISRASLENWPQKVVFGQQLILLGYELVPESWVISGDVMIRTFWRSLDHTQANLKVFLHFTRESESGIGSTPLSRKLGFGRRDFFQGDHMLLLNGQPSSMWIPGTFIAHEHFFSIPEDAHPGHYKIEIGLYPEGSTKDRILITRSDRPFDKDRALLGTVLLSDK